MYVADVRRTLSTIALAAAAAALACPAVAGAALDVKAQPKLSPAFASGIDDYVTRCTPGRAVRLSLSAPAGGTLAVNGRPPRSGSFEDSVKLGVGQGMTIRARSGGASHDYHVRCLPKRFQHLQATRFGPTQAEWYLIAPVAPPGSRYVMIVDSHGTPVWWVKQKHAPFNSVLFDNDELAWTRYYGDPTGIRHGEAWEVHRLDGTHVLTLKTSGSPTDTHDFERMPNGDYLMITYKLRRDVDLSAWGKGKHENVLDGEVQEKTPAGKLVWRWNSKDHITLDETQTWPSPRAYRLPDGTKAYDLIHLNSVQPDGDGVVMSARRMNAVFRVSKATGDLTWKIGGATRKETLTVLGDTKDQTFGAQHDARLLPDGDVTVFDNRTGIDAPRGVRFHLDLAARTATVVGQVSDPKVDFSGALGSTRILPGGDWVEDWGSNNPMTELTSTGKVVFRMYFKGGGNYRATPLPYGRMPGSKLRGAMDAIYRRSRG